MLPRSCAGLAIACNALLAVPAIAADRVLLRNGTSVEGRIVFDSPAKLILLQGTQEVEVEVGEVVEVRSVERSLTELLTRWHAASNNSAGARLELARFARAAELEGEAQLLALGALVLDPSFAAAHEFLGHTLIREVWHVRERKREVPFTQLDSARGDWKNAWQFQTLHYELRTNLPLAQAFTVAVELELLYRAFFTRFRPELGLRDVVERMAVHVHADQASYPGGSGRIGFYDRDIDTLMQNAEKGFQPFVIAHEGTHQLLENTAVRTRASLGAIPGWIHEGLADTIAYSRSGPLGHAKYAPKSSAAFYFSIHARAKKPYDLARVLTLEAADFSISSHIALGYAQSYTLVHYCLNGEQGKFRAGFFEFLRRCYEGKPSMTAFKSALNIKETEFEAAWHAYAKHGP